MKYRALLLALMAFVGLSIPGCHEVQRKLGIGVVVESPAPASPEAVVQAVLRSALVEDEETGWQAFVRLLHSEDLDSPRSLQHWREYKYRGIRKKAHLLVEDRTSVRYREMDVVKEGNTLIIKVKNQKSDTPAPCRLRKDPRARDQWRVFGSCF